MEVQTGPVTAGSPNYIFMILNTLVVAVPVVIGTIIAILAVIALRKYLREKKKDRSEK